MSKKSGGKFTDKYFFQLVADNRSILLLSAELQSFLAELIKIRLWPCIVIIFDRQVTGSHVRRNCFANRSIT